MPPRKRNVRVRLHWSRIILVMILTFVLAEVTLAFARKIWLQRDIHARLERAQAELYALQEENVRLKKEKEALYSPEKIEELAREKLGLTKPHEIAVKIIKKSPPPLVGQGKSQSPSKSLWEKIKEEIPIKWLLK